MNTEIANPLIPAGFDIAWASITLLGALLTIATVWSILRRRSGVSLSGDRQVVWVVVVVIAPVLGPLLWWTIGRPRAARTIEESTAGRASAAG